MSRFITRAWWMAVGAAIAHYFDPINGHGRRARLRNQLVARWNDLLDLAERRTKYELGRAKGAIIETVHTEDPPHDDRALLQKVRSEAVGPTPDLPDHVHVRVDHGVVTLTGRSENPTAERELMRRIGDVVGVKGIRNELTPA
ncbi:MAG: BON domain-containing protein [Acidimicrobiia bacterium]